MMNQQLNTILDALENYPDGASIEEIEHQAGLGLERRTLQRRLTKLEQQGKIIFIGKLRGRKYRLTKTLQEPQQSEIPLSTAGAQLHSLISQPLTTRKPVAHDPDFLLAYQPNKTHYFSTNEIKKLHQLGRTTHDQQFAGTYAKEIFSRLMIDLSWNSSRLEGNTYSLLDTQKLLEQGEPAQDKSTLDAQMILNHKDAIEFLVFDAQNIDYNSYTICNLHAMLSNNLMPDPNACGRLRHIPVGIAYSSYKPPEIPQVINDMFLQILSTLKQIKEPFEQSLFAMVHLPYLQAFDDVNKRVSRLTANIPLLKNNLSPLSFTDVPENTYISAMLAVYEQRDPALLKDVYLWAYERAANKYAAIRQALGQPDTLKLKYRQQIQTTINHIITSTMDQHQARNLIEDQARKLPTKDQSKFIEIVETEVLALHPGNFARYGVTPREFNAWQNIWSA